MYSECVLVAFVTQHAKRMHRVLLSYMASPTLQQFSTLSHKIQVFRKIFVGHKMCIWIFFMTLCEAFLILRRNRQDMFINISRYSCKVSLFLSDFNKTCIFWKEFRKILQYEFSRKSVQWEPSCSMRTEGQTRHDEANSRFSQFCESG